jgi:hypothetical protein
VQLEVSDARVLAVDQEGRPALLTKPVGHGHTVICAYPLEYALGSTANAFEKPGNCQRLYRGLKALAQIQSPFTVADPVIELGWFLSQDRDYVTLINHSSDFIRTYVEAKIPGKAHFLAPDGPQARTSADIGFNVELPGFSGSVYEWEHTNK